MRQKLHFLTYTRAELPFLLTNHLYSIQSQAAWAPLSQVMFFSYATTAKVFDAFLSHGRVEFCRSAALPVRPQLLQDQCGESCQVGTSHHPVESRHIRRNDSTCF